MVKSKRLSVILSVGYPLPCVPTISPAVGRFTRGLCNPALCTCEAAESEKVDLSDLSASTPSSGSRGNLRAEAVDLSRARLWAGTRPVRVSPRHAGIGRLSRGSRGALPHGGGG